MKQAQAQQYLRLRYSDVSSALRGPNHTQWLKMTIESRVSDKILTL